MRKLFLGLMAFVMSVSVLTAGMPVAEAKPASYNRLTSEEKKAFDKLYKETSTSKLQNVSVSYSSSISGKSDINQYRWTVWRNDTKNSTINKKANNGNGNYSGFSKSKVQSWSRDEAYINAIKNLNNGKFPATKDYKYPTTTSGDTLDFWMGEPGFYSILGDPRYKNITLKGYRTFKWTEKIKKTKTETDKKDTGYYTIPGASSNGRRWDRTALKTKLKASSLIKEIAKDLGKSTDWLVNEICNNMDETKVKVNGSGTADTTAYKGAYSGTLKSGDVSYKITFTIIPDKEYNSNDATTGGRLFYGTLKATKTKKKTYYETKSHSKKQQIAQTVVAKNAYATQIQKYGTFYLTPKSNVSSNTIKQRNTGFWGSVKPSYHQSNPKTQDQGNYTWTFSTNVSSGKKSYNLYASITQKYKFFDDIADLMPSVPNNEVPNPPADPDVPLPPITNNPDNPGGGNNNGGNPGGGNNGGNPSDPDNPGGGNNPDNPGGGNNGGGNGNNGGGGTDPTDPDNPDKIGDKDNPPMMNIEIDIDDGIDERRMPTMVHLYDLYQR